MTRAIEMVEVGTTKAAPAREGGGQKADLAFALAILAWGSSIYFAHGMDDLPRHLRAVLAFIPPLIAAAAFITSVVAFVRDEVNRMRAVWAAMLSGFYLLVLVVGVMAIGALVQARANNGPPPFVPAASAGPALTDEEVKAFAKEIEETIAKGDPSFFDGSLDRRALVERSAAGLPDDPALREGVIRGLGKSQTTVGTEVARMVRDGGSYTLLRVRSEGGRPTLLFRHVMSDGVINYHELYLRRGADGAPKYDDLNVFVGGTRLSESLRRGFRDEAGLDDTIGMTRPMREGRPQEALAFHDRLPAKRRDQKALLLLRVKAAEAVGDAEHRDALEHLERLGAGDPAVDLVLLGVYSERGEHDRIVKVIESIDEAVGGDPYLAAMKASALLQSGDVPAARVAAEQATAQEPTLRYAQVIRLEVVVAQRDHAATADALTALETGFGQRTGGVATSPVFADFVASAEGAAWLSERSKD